MDNLSSIISSDGTGFQVITETCWVGDSSTEHCIFCGKKGEVPAANVTSQSIATVNLIWCWIETKKKMEGICGLLGSGDYLPSLLEVMMEVQKIGTVHLTSFDDEKPPTLCQGCAENVVEVEVAVTYLQNKVEVLMKILGESKKVEEGDFGSPPHETEVKEEEGADVKTEVDDDEDAGPLDDPLQQELDQEDDDDTSRTESAVEDEEYDGFDEIKLECVMEVEEDDTTMSSMIEDPLSCEATVTNTSNRLSRAAKRKCQSSAESCSKPSKRKRKLKERTNKRNANPVKTRKKKVTKEESEKKEEDAKEIGKTLPKPAPEELSDSDVEAMLAAAWKPTLNMFVCPEENCGKTINQKSGFLFHFKIKHNKVFGSIVCTCGVRFLNKSLLMKHMNRSKLHRKVNRIPRKEMQLCDLCGEAQRTSSILEHVKGHVGDYAISCPNKNCSYVCSNSHALFSHYLNFRRTRVISDHETVLHAICDTCGFKTNNGLVFRKHLKVVHERGSDKPFECPLSGCDKRFVVRQSVDWHIATHNELRPVTHQKCDNCEEKVKIEEIEQHLMTAHKCEDIISCQQCSCKFSSRDGLVDHLFQHRFQGMFCDICQDGVKFSRHVELRQHYQTAHQLKRSKTHPCEFCGKEFDLLPSLKQHISLKHSTYDKKEKAATVSCDICFGTTTFKSEDSLISHKIRVHGAEPFTCGTCGLKLTNIQALSKHEKEHAGITFEKEWKCEVEGCGKVFTGYKKSLTRHMKLYHNGRTKDHVCNICGKAYWEAKDLKNHHDIVHLGIRSWVCEICGEAFTNGTVLKKHRMIHTGERPFSCKICDQRFRHKEVLQKHVSSHLEKGADFKPNGPMKQVRKRRAQ